MFSPLFYTNKHFLYVSIIKDIHRLLLNHTDLPEILIEKIVDFAKPSLVSTFYLPYIRHNNHLDLWCGCIAEKDDRNYACNISQSFSHRTYQIQVFADFRIIEEFPDVSSAICYLLNYLIANKYQITKQPDEILHEILKNKNDYWNKYCGVQIL